MKKKSKSKNYIVNNIKVIIGIVMLLTISTSIIVVALRKDSVEPNIIEANDSIDEEDNDESSLNTEYLPLIRVSFYEAETGNRNGYVITNNGIIFKYAFNETKVDYPNSDIFAINQTLYFNNIVEEVGNVSEEDLDKLIRYSETIDNNYDTDDMVFDTVGNSISVTNYFKEDIYVLINNEGIINKSVNTMNILNILNKYNLGL